MELELGPSIVHQNEQEAKNFDAISKTKKQSIDNDLAWAECQYSSPNLSILEAFFVNLISLPVEKADSFKFEGVKEQSHKIFFAATANEKFSEYSRQVSQKTHQTPVTPYVEPTATPSVDNSRTFDEEHCSLKLAILSQLQQQQDNRFHDFN